MVDLDKAWVEAYKVKNRQLEKQNKELEKKVLELEKLLEKSGNGSDGRFYKMIQEMQRKIGALYDKIEKMEKESKTEPVCKFLNEMMLDVSKYEAEILKMIPDGVEFDSTEFEKFLIVLRQRFEKQDNFANIIKNHYNFYCILFFLLEKYKEINPNCSFLSDFRRDFYIILSKNINLDLFDMEKIRNDIKMLKENCFTCVNKGKKFVDFRSDFI